MGDTSSTAISFTLKVRPSETHIKMSDAVRLHIRLERSRIEINTQLILNHIRASLKDILGKDSGPSLSDSDKSAVIESDAPFNRFFCNRPEASFLSSSENELGSPFFRSIPLWTLTDK